MSSFAAHIGKVIGLFGRFLFQEASVVFFFFFVLHNPAFISQFFLNHFFFSFFFFSFTCILVSETIRKKNAH